MQVNPGVSGAMSITVLFSGKTIQVCLPSNWQGGLMMKRAVLNAALLLPLGTHGSAAQENVESANWVMPGCRAVLNDKSGEEFKSGVCAGVVATLRALGSVNLLGYCIPNGVINGQAVQVAVAYIECNPARQHERFDALTIEAFRQAWPCP
jgi:hypothetical protein